MLAHGPDPVPYTGKEIKESKVKTMPHIEKFKTTTGKTAYQAFDPVNMMVCGHKHRYEAAAKPCLKEMLQNEQVAEADGGNITTEQLLEADRMAQTNVVEELIDGRRAVYGEPRDTYPRIAQVWSGITGAPITAEMVPLMMIGYKLVRAVVAPDYSDNSDDVEGYLAIFRELVGDDMVHARSVDDYIAQKQGRTG